MSCSESWPHCERESSASRRFETTWSENIPRRCLSVSGVRVQLSNSHGRFATRLTCKLARSNVEIEISMRALLSASTAFLWVAYAAMAQEPLTLVRTIELPRVE